MRGLAVVLMLTASLGVAAPAAGYTEIRPAELAGLLRAKDVVLVNVHVPYAGEIERTDAFIRFDAIEANLRRLPVRRDTKLVVYCRSGAMGTIAARTLARLG